MGCSKEVISPAELSALLGTTENVLSFWRSVGRGPKAVHGVCLGDARRSVGYRVDDVEAWFNSAKPWTRQTALKGKLPD